MKIIGLLTAAAFLAACTNTTAELVSAPENYDGQLKTDQSAQSAYRHLREAGRLCMEASPMGTPVIIESEFDGELHEGQITQRMIAQGVRLNIAVIDIKQNDASSSVIKLYSLKGLAVSGTRRPSLEQLKKWLAGDKSC